MTAFDAADWWTLGAAIKESGLPAPMLEGAVLAGRLEVLAVCGELLLRKAEVKALALSLRAERECAGCE